MMIPLHTSLRGEATSGYRIAIVVLLAAFLLGIGYSASGNSQTKNSAPAKAKAADKGMFKVFYAPVKNPEYKEVANEMKKGQVLEGIAADLNQTLSLPSDITLVLTECGEVNAFYN